MRLKPDWEARADIEVVIWDEVYKLSVIEQALRNYPDAPPGFSEISAKLTEYANLYHDYCHQNLEQEGIDDDE